MRNVVPLSSFPCFRIWTLGIFRIESLVDPREGTYRQLPLSQLGGKYGRLLLTSLFCSYGRRLLRSDAFDRIMLAPTEEDGETDPRSSPDPQKSREQDPSKRAASRLKGAIRSLTALFTPEGSTESFFVIEDEIDCYRLAGQETIWVDADACLDLLDQAREAARTAHDPLPYITEAANYFASGIFLQNEEGWWIAARRSTLEERQQHCFSWLIDLYEQHELWWEAERWLLRLIEQDASDEASFSRLIDLLIKQGKHTEAFVYARSLRERLQEEDIEITEPTRTLMNQVLRLHKKHTFVAAQMSIAMQEQRVETGLLPPPFPFAQASFQGRRETKEEFDEPIVFVEARESGVLIPSSVSMSLHPISETPPGDCATWFSERLAHILAFVTQWQRRVSSTDFEKLLDRELRVFDESKAMFHPDDYFLSRRSALLAIAALPQGLLRLMEQQQKVAFIEGEFLPACAASLTACWYLLNGREFASVERALSRLCLSMISGTNFESEWEQ
ncbi:MAG TPA: bacterial transcriptional activator domain-containing protein [Ktedonobacteraceae bacterium]|nr:bacterial transcriptional activator domain-containing protein [Ktedonobacteraceae bacterium]